LADEVTVVVVPDWFTVCVRMLDVLVLKLPSPPYTAVIECEPTLRVLVANVATPEPSSVPVPTVVAPSLKVTVPVGIPEPGALAVTVAVKVTDCPNEEGFALEVRAVVVGSLFTVWVRMVEVLVLKLPSPPYTPVMECAATVRALVVKVATPEPSRVPVPSMAAPSLNVTVPVGVPEPGAEAVTVAVNVTDWPLTDGLAEEATAVPVPALFTVWFTVLEVLVLKLPSPAYTAVTEWGPTLSVVVAKVATPEPLSVPVPIVATPSLKVTVPVGVPAPGALAVTVAVNVIDWPKTEGLADGVKAVLLLAGLTVWLIAVEVLVTKLASPPYTAVIECGEPLTERAEVFKVAMPEPLSVPVPSVAKPSLKVTVPLAVPEPGALAVTVAVKVTDWPNTEGLAEDVRAVVVASLFTVCDRAGEVLVLKFESPP
jgi:hypothetical protein